MFKINKKILLSIFFFLTLFSITNINAFIIEGNTTMQVHLTGKLGSTAFDFTENRTFFDINECLSNSPTLEGCSALRVVADLQDFIEQKVFKEAFVVPWKINDYEPTLYVSIYGGPGGSNPYEFITSKYVAGFNYKSNISTEISCNGVEWFDNGDCYLVNGTINMIFVIGEKIYEDIYIEAAVIVKRVINDSETVFRITPSLTLKTDPTGYTEEFYSGITQIYLQPSTNLNISINNTNLSIGDYYNISVDYNEFNLPDFKSACVEIGYSETNISECQDNTFTDSIVLRTITNNFFRLTVKAFGKSINGTNARKKVIFRINENLLITTTDLSGAIITAPSDVDLSNLPVINFDKPLICKGDYNNTDEMLAEYEKIGGQLCEYTNTLIINQENSYSDSVDTGGGGDTANNIILYQTWGNFADDVGILPSAVNSIKVFYESFKGTDNYYYGVGFSSRNQGIKTLCRDELCITLNVTKAGTICNTAFGPPVSDMTIVFSSKLGKIVNSSPFTYDFSGSLSAICHGTETTSPLLTSWLGAGISGMKLGSGPRTVIYGRSATVGAFMNKTDDSRLTDLLISSNDTFYDLYNNTIFNESSNHGYIASSTTGLKTFIELSPYSKTLSSKFFDFGLSSNNAATLFIDDGSIEIAKRYLTKFNFIDKETFLPIIEDVYFTIIGGNKESTWRINTSSITWNLFEGNYTIKAQTFNIDNTTAKISPAKKINVDKEAEYNLFFFSDRYGFAPTNFTPFSFVIDDGAGLNGVEYIVTTHCNINTLLEFNLTDTTINKGFNYIISNDKLPFSNNFNCQVTIKGLDGVIIKTFYDAFTKNFFNIRTYSIIGVTSPPDTGFVSNITKGGFTDMQVTAYRNLINSAWFLIVELSGGNKLIISIFIVSIAVWIMNFGKEGKSVNSEVQIALIALIFITLILIGFINAIIGILFIVLLGVLFGKKFHESIGNNGGSE